MIKTQVKKIKKEGRKMTYEEALEYIAATNWRGSKLGLERITQLCALLGDPQKDLKFIHVAGTNGKGSVCAFLSSILYKAGYKVGLFTSPYIEVFNERMQINGKNISDEELAAVTEYVRPFADSMEDLPTEFELNTAIAFEYFKRNSCDIVVLEAGMGGELDSTNVIDPPVLAVIMHIALDHTEELGDTIEKIAKTKAGIIKPGSSVVLYKQDEAVHEIIREKCSGAGASLYISEPESIELMDIDIDRQVFRAKDFGPLAIPLIGSYQLENAAAALKAVQVLRQLGWHITTSNVADGLENTAWPGRFEVIKRKPIFIVDGGHNVDGIRATAKSLKAVFKEEKLILIFGVMADKNYDEMLDIILPFAKEVCCVAPNNERALAADKLAEVIESKGVSACPYESIPEAADAAFERSKKVTPVCAIGSLYMIGDIKKYINEKY